ncbi:cell division protein FtsW [Paraneptunicella aestuarii]|uniref:cell division protein FtsW n=1 Tax=Paraneptunicella aestuarii TaxID=2831148 RepID=UPI001E651398|nr:cell division protein FtsW [Paraneptunicella aestuarii]
MRHETQGSSFSVSGSLQQLFQQRYEKSKQYKAYDVMLVLVAFALLCLGFVMVTSASIPVAERMFNNPFHFSIRHGIYMAIACSAGMITMMIPMSWWKASNGWLLLLAILLLLAVLVVGRTVNGSTRWLVIGPFTVQAAEPAKLFFFCYLAGYLVRRYGEVTENIKGFIKPLIVFFVLALLLLKQPDLGTVIVMFATTVSLLFLAGAKLWQFFGLAFAGISAVVALIVFEEYRMKRVTAFLDPWADPFGTGYQLTQSLMAFGRGDLFGQGLGNSLQKLEFLPEAHTDFIVAIIAEELGFTGVIAILGLLFFIVVKALVIGNRALQKNLAFEAYLAYAIGVWIAFQTAVNVGASSGVLPTKGLTLPLVSSGGSSLIIMCIAVSILVRIDFELRVMGVQAMSKSDKKRAAHSKSESKSQEAVSAEISDSQEETKTSKWKSLFSRRSKQESESDSETVSRKVLDTDELDDFMDDVNADYDQELIGDDEPPFDADIDYRRGRS